MQHTKQPIQIRADLAELDRVRREITALCTGWGMSRLATLRFVLAVDEVTANVIEHGVEEYDGTIEIRADEKNNDVVVQILDPGRPFDPTLVDDFDPGSVTRRKRGFGIHLIKLIACNVKYCRTSDDRNCLTLTLPIS